MDSREPSNRARIESSFWWRKEGVVNRTLWGVGLAAIMRGFEDNSYPVKTPEALPSMETVPGENLKDP
jgi:hypothetical protein